MIIKKLRIIIISSLFIGSLSFHTLLKTQAVKEKIKREASPLSKPTKTLATPPKIKIPSAPTKPLPELPKEITKKTTKRRIRPRKPDRPLPQIPDEKNDDDEPDEAEQPKPIGKGALEKIKSVVTGALPRAILKIAENLTTKIKRDLRLSEIADKFKIPPGKFRNYLNRFVITTPVVKSRDGGVVIEGKIKVQDKVLKAFLEVGKSEGSWYGIFYVKADKRWRLTEFLPEFSLKTIFPKMSAKIANKFKPDLLEFIDSYFLISSADIEGHPKLGDVKKGVRFRANAIFIGFLKILDKIFGLKGKPVKVEGFIGSPLVTSEFSVKVPTTAMILPESFTHKGKRKNLIRGFHIRLAPFSFDIKFRKIGTLIVPYLQARPAVMVKFPFTKEEKRFFGGLDFFGERMKLYFGIEEPIPNFIGVKGLELLSGRAGLTWDFGVGIASGGVFLILPSGIIFKGGLKSPASNLDFDVDIGLHSRKGVDFKWVSKGTFLTHEFIKFMADNVFKKPQLFDKMKKIIPNIIVEDADIDVDLSETAAKKHFRLEIGKIELLKGYPFSGRLEIAGTGVGGTLHTWPINFPKKNPKVKFTSFDKPDVGPKVSVDIDLFKKPMRFDFGIDGLMLLDFGPLGKIESKSKGVISKGKVNLKSRTKLLGIDTKLEIIGAKDETGTIDKKNIKITLDSTNKGLVHISNTLKKLATVELEKAKKKILDKKNATLAQIKEQKLLEVRRIDDQITPFVKRVLDLTVQFASGLISAKEYKRLFKKLKEGVQDHKKKVNLKRFEKGVQKQIVKFGATHLRTVTQVVQFFSGAFYRITRALSLLEKVFKVNELKLVSTLGELGDGKLPLITLKGVAFKKPFSIVEKRIDLSKFINVVKMILRKLKIIKTKEEAIGKMEVVTEPLSEHDKRVGIEADFEEDEIIPEGAAAAA